MLSVDLGRPIPEQFLARLASQPEVEPPEVFLQGFAYWVKPNGGSELCIVMGSRLEDDALGWVDGLTPGTAGAADRAGVRGRGRNRVRRLGIKGVGDTAEMAGHRVRVVG